jgi:cysteine desulfurase
MTKPIYLDYMATTPVDPSVCEKMMACLTASGTFGNPASTSHAYGWEAKELVQEARGQIAELIQADPREIIFTSGATEANNLALKGAASFYERKGRHIITSAIEHKSVLDTLQHLASKGYEITHIYPDKKGLVSPADIKAQIRPDTILVSIMHANNEIGTIQNIEEIGALVAGQGIIFHVDAAQSLGKIPIDLRKLNVDLMSFSAHKLYGPKGIGALYIRRKPRVRLEPMIHGGGHELGVRSGTLATHQIVGMGEACRLASANLMHESQRLSDLKKRLWQGIAHLGGLHLNGDETARLPGNLNISFEYIEGESLLLALHEIAVSSGAACNSATIEPSHVLLAIGLSNELANSSIRFSLGRYTTEEDINRTIAHVCHVVTRMREISPLGRS